MTAHPPNRWAKVRLVGVSRGRKWTLPREQHLCNTVHTLQAVYRAPTRASVSTVLLQDRAICRYRREKLSTAAMVGCCCTPPERQTNRPTDRCLKHTAPMRRPIEPKPLNEAERDQERRTTARHVTAHCTRHKHRTPRRLIQIYTHVQIYQ